MLLAGRCPPARLTAAGAGEGVAAAVGAALAGELAEPSPVVGVAGAEPARRVAAPVGVARAAPLAVGAPILLGAACKGKEMARMVRGVSWGSPAAPRVSRLAKVMSRAEPWGITHGNCSLLRRSRVCRGKPRVSHRPRPPRRHPPPRTVLSAAGQARQRATVPPRAHTPLPDHPPPGHLPPRQPSGENRHPASRSIPPAEPQLARWAFGGPHSAAPHRHRLRRAVGLPPNTQRLGGATRPSAGTELWVVHHSPAVHSRPSCFQPGQHAGPVGSLWERPRGSQPGRGVPGPGQVRMWLHSFG